MKPKVLKTEAEYEAALAHMAGLMDAAPGSPEEAELELFGLLIEQYEKEHYPIGLPDPIDAILFRMDQEGLTRKDLAKYIGSPSKVSEILNRKRPLSLAMMRGLHEGLGIPAAVLLQEPGRKLPENHFDWRDYPFGEMLKRGYFGEYRGKLSEAREYAEELLEQFFAVLGPRSAELVLCRRSERGMDMNALRAWQARAVTLAATQALPPFTEQGIDEGFMSKAMHLSYYTEGPALVRELLQKRGVHFVVAKHLPGTYLDGACFRAPVGAPIIGMTLRHDRLDNFWFTLAHELAHLRLHLRDDVAFFDDTEREGCEDDDPREDEANAAARRTDPRRGVARGGAWAGARG